jgi:spermidine dehydrogenase
VIGRDYLDGSTSDPVVVGEQPYEIARARAGQVAIANADAPWSPFAHAAIDQAHRAVGELLGER